MPRPTPSQPRARKPAASSPAAASRTDGEGTVRFARHNWLFLAAGLVSIVIGYVLLDNGSVDLAPALLVLGYVVLIPLGIIWQVKGTEKGA